MSENDTSPGLHFSVFDVILIAENKITVKINSGIKFKKD